MSRKSSISAKMLALGLSLVLSQWSFAAPREVVEDPSALAMTADLVFVRPVTFGMTVIGSAAWLLGLPFSAAGGNIKGSAETLVVGPAKTTFVRCLGCTRTGYQRVVEAEDE